MNLKKPIALLLTPVLPLPKASGRALRSWDWLQTLLKKHRVHVIAPGDSTDRYAVPEDYPAEGVWWTGNAMVSMPRSLKAIGLLFPFLSPWFRNLVEDWVIPAPSFRFLEDLSSRLGGEPVRRIVVFRLYLHDVALAVFERFPDAIIDMDLDDHESHTRLSIAGALARMGRYQGAARQFSAAIQYWFIERFLPGPYDTAYFAAKEDCYRFSTHLAGVIDSRPNRVNVPVDFPSAPPKKELHLLFVGTLGYPPNEEAVRFMIVHLLPELRKHLARPWRLFIIGRHAPVRLSRLIKSCEQVDFISDADDLEKWYAGAHIVLVPLSSGGGTKFKTIEGFAHRRPVVSTSHGVRGLGALAGEHYLLAETPVAFALAIRRLAQDQALADRVAEAGWKLCFKGFRIE